MYSLRINGNEVPNIQSFEISKEGEANGFYANLMPDLSNPMFYRICMQFDKKDAENFFNKLNRFVHLDYNYSNLGMEDVSKRTDLTTHYPILFQTARVIAYTATYGTDCWICWIEIVADDCGDLSVIKKGE